MRRLGVRRAVVVAVWRMAFSGAVLCWALAGCRSHDATQLVVGIQSDPMGGVVSALHVVIRVAGTVVDDERIEPPHGSRVGFPQPWEKTISGAGRDAAKVEVAIDAIGDPAAKPLFTRLSSTPLRPRDARRFCAFRSSRAASSTRPCRGVRARFRAR